MKNLFFLIILFFAQLTGLSADQTDGDFISALTHVRNPFVVDLPKQGFIQRQPTKPPETPLVLASPQAVVKTKEVLQLPDLKLQGVVVGPDMHQAIINDHIVGQQEMVQGAWVVAIRQDEVELLFKGKKFVLKTELQH